MPINHRKHSNAPDVGDAASVLISDWNAALIGTGGLEGLPLIRLSAHPDGMDFATSAAQVRAALGVYSQDEVDGIIAANPGPPGPQGDVGPAGPPGVTAGSFDYRFNNTPTPPPAEGNVRFNQTAYASVTTVWMHRIDNAGSDQRTILLLRQPGDRMRIEDRDNADVYATYDLIADPVDSGSYVTFAVQFRATAGTLPQGLISIYLGGASAGIPQSTIDAKGDLLVGSAPDAVTRLGIGADFTMLRADAAQPLGLAWVPPGTVRATLDVFSKAEVQGGVALTALTLGNVKPLFGMLADGSAATPLIHRGADDVTRVGDGVRAVDVGTSVLSLGNNTAVFGRLADGSTHTPLIVRGPDNYTYVGDGVHLNFLNGDVYVQGNLNVTGTITPAPTVADNAITNAKLRDSTANSVIGRSISTAGDPADIVSSGDGVVLRRTGSTLGFGTLDLANANTFTGVLPIARGGTASVVNLAIGLIPGGRITLGSQFGSVVLYNPTVHGMISLLSGGDWKVFNMAALSLGLDLSGMSANSQHDIFLYDNAGTLTLVSNQWTNATTRQTAISQVDGIWVQTSNTARRYLGTVRANATPTFEDTEAHRYVWNAYNRIPLAMKVLEGTNSWTYTTTAFRQANGLAANALDFVIGLTGDMVEAEVHALFAATAANIAVASGIGLDSTTGNWTSIYGAVSPAANVLAVSRTVYRGAPSIGRHLLNWLEYGNTGVTFYGDNNAPTSQQSGISGWLLG